LARILDTTLTITQVEQNVNGFKYEQIVNFGARVLDVEKLQQFLCDLHNGVSTTAGKQFPVRYVLRQICSIQKKPASFSIFWKKIL
jgi:hypothetical protein